MTELIMGHGPIQSATEGSSMSWLNLSEFDGVGVRIRIFLGGSICTYDHTSGAGVFDRQCTSRCRKGHCEGQLLRRLPRDSQQRMSEVHNCPKRAKVAERPELWNPRPSGMRLEE